MWKRSRTDFLYKIWNILMPLVIQYVVYLTSFFLLSCFYRIIVGKSGVGMSAFLQEQEITLTGIVNGVSMLLGALVLVPMLRVELREQRGRTVRYRAENIPGLHNSGRSGMVILTIVLAAASSLGLNILMTLTGFAQSSSGYQEVAQAQYGVTFWVGLILYIMVSPVSEEIVFRGIIYNRMRRYLSEWRPPKNGGYDMAAVAAMIASGVLFGIYHGNMVQGVYGGCMGILMAYMYERTHAFYTPCLFHATANCVVYLTAQSAAVYEQIFTVPCCVGLLIIALVVVLISVKSRII